MTTQRRFTHAIVYTGAPYGLNEAGEIRSRHTSRSNAEKAYDRKYSGTTGVYSYQVVKLSEWS